MSQQNQINRNLQKNEPSQQKAQNYNQDDHEWTGPVQVNDEYYNEYEDRNQDNEDQFEHYDPQNQENNQEDENDHQHLQQHNQNLQQQFEKQSQIYEQNQRLQGLKQQRVNLENQQNNDNHIREQTEEYMNYDEEIMQDVQSQGHEEDQDEEHGIHQQEFNQQKYQEQLKSSLQQKRYSQPKQFIEYKASQNAYQPDEDESEPNNQYDDQDSSQEQFQINKNQQPQHYFGIQNNNFRYQNNDKKIQIKNESDSLSNQLEGMTNNSNINDDKSKSDIMSKIRQDESHLEASQINPYDEHDGGKKQHLLDSPGNIELIKHSKYYQKYLNGESLNESYSVLPSQTNQNIPSMQNSTSFIDPKGLAASIDPSIQGNELYVLKIKLFESNNKLMLEMNKNKQLRNENQEMKLTIDNLQFQLQQSQNTTAVVQETQQYLQQSNSQYHHPSQQQMTNTYNSPIQSPTFESLPPQNNQQNQTLQHRNQQLEEEYNKNYNLRQDLEHLRTRLLQEMNNSNQYEQQLRESERIVKQHQSEVQEKSQILNDKKDEIRKLMSTAEGYRMEIQNLNKIKSHQEDQDRQKRELTQELQTMKTENKSMQQKVVNYNQDNLRLFSEIQILKQKLEKSDNQVVSSQNQLYNQKAELNQQQQSHVSTKQYNYSIEKLQIELNELRSNLIATSQQLEHQQERNEYLSIRLEEAEKISRSKNQQKQQSSINQSIIRNSPPKYRNESDLEYQQRLMDHQIQEKHHQLERDYQQKQLELITQMSNRQNTTKQQCYICNNDQNERTLRQSHQQESYESRQEQQHHCHPKTRNLDEHNQYYNDQYYQQEQQRQLNNSTYNSQNQNLNPNSQNYYNTNIQQGYESMKRDNYTQPQQQQQSQSKKLTSPSTQNLKQDSPPTRAKKSKTQQNANDHLFYQDLEEEKQKLQNHPQYIPIGVTSQNENNYISSTQKIKDLDYHLNQLLQKKKLAESELLKLEENKRKSQMIIIQKQELEQRIEQYSLDISNTKGQLRQLNALK